MSSKSQHQPVPLSVLLQRDSEDEKMEKPEIVHGVASQSKKGEDFTLLKTECQRTIGDDVATFSVFGLFDGHNGSAAAIYTKENLLNNVLNAIPADLNTDEWVAALPRALVAGFVKTDKDFQEKAKISGTTVTLVIIEGWFITVASVGDSRCIFDSPDGGIYHLSADHRLECNEEERERITSSGGDIGRLNAGGGTEVPSSLAFLLLVRFECFNTFSFKAVKLNTLKHVNGCATGILGKRNLEAGFGHFMTLWKSISKDIKLM